MKYQEENNKLIESFLKRTFFKGWRNPKTEKLANFQSVEIWLNNKCNLSCKYCYINQYGDDLYSSENQDGQKVLKNLEMFLNWLIKNKFAPKFELFSGEPFVQEVGFKAIEMILEKYKNIKNKPPFLIVPTNYTFLLSEKLTKKVEDLLRKSRRIGIPVSLSASFDGKYCEKNRPFKNMKSNQIDPRNDKYYDKAFAFNKKWGFGFHPMIYSEGIKNWQKNWLWFQKNFQKHNISWDNIYLLEVRNAEWRDKQILEFGKFIEFLIKWTFHNSCHDDIEKFLFFLFRRGYNMLQSPFTTIGRGIGCSIQSTFHVRLGDLALVPCHRTSYPPFVYGYFKVKNNKLTKIEISNPELMLAIYSFDAKNQPQCENCLLKNVCSFGCLGSQFETTGDLFSPIPTVCQLEHVKIASIIKALKELKVFKAVLNRTDPRKSETLKKIEQLICQQGIKWF
jgi:radical SAM protein with 4Fe4S-binding SPASM domain